MKSLLSRLLDLILLLSIVILLFALGRAMLYFANLTHFTNFSASELLSAFFAGFIYDFHMVLISNSLFIFLFLFPFKNHHSPFYLSFLKIYYVLINSITLLANLFDIGFYASFAKRVNFGSFYNEIPDSLEHIEKASFRNFIDNYWIVILLWILMVTALSYALWFVKAHTIEHRKKSIAYKGISSCVFILMIAFFIQSGSTRESWMKDLYLKADRKLTALVVNNPYLILRTINGDFIRREKEWYFEEYNPQKSYESLDFPENKTIRIILFDSSVPFDSNNLGKKNKNFARGFQYKVIETGHKHVFSYLDQILIGTPDMMNTEFYHSVYSLNQFNSLVQMISGSGYRSSLFAFGTDKKIAKLLKNFYGFNRLQFIEKEDLKSGNGLFREGTEENHPKNLEFYLIRIDESAKQITPDELIQSFACITEDKYSLNAITFIFFSSSGKNAPIPELKSSLFVMIDGRPSFPGNHERIIAQPSDIFPSILHYINYQMPFIAYGSSLFSNEEKTIVLRTGDENYMVLKDSLLANMLKGETHVLHLLRHEKFSTKDYQDSLLVEKIQLENIMQNMHNDFKQRLYHGELN